MIEILLFPFSLLLLIGIPAVRKIKRLNNEERRKIISKLKEAKNKITCKDCKFYLPIKNTSKLCSEVESVKGKCICHPPKVNTCYVKGKAPMVYHYSEQPEVDCWQSICGEFKK